MERHKNKKGQINLGESPRFIQILLILAITLAVASLIIAGFRTQGVTYTTTIVANESHNVTVNANTTLDVLTQSRFIEIITVYNDTVGSNGVNIASANYTAREVVGQTLFQLIAVTGQPNEHNGSILNITYSYNADPNDHFSNITETGLAGMQQIGDFQDLIALVIVAVVILGLILFIGSRGNR